VTTVSPALKSVLRRVSAYCSKYFRSVLFPIDAASASTLIGPPWPVAYKAHATLNRRVGGSLISRAFCVRRTLRQSEVSTFGGATSRGLSVSELMHEGLKPCLRAAEVLQVRLVIAIAQVARQCGSTPAAERTTDGAPLFF
jgi:hypothetical protein